MFADKFTTYNDCAPAGVLLPKIKIEKKFYKKLNLNEGVDNLKFLKKLCWESIKEMVAPTSTSSGTASLLALEIGRASCRERV